MSLPPEENKRIEMTVALTCCPLLAGEFDDTMAGFHPLDLVNLGPAAVTLPPSPPARINIARHCLTDHAHSQPDKTALIIAGPGGSERRWSYAELDLAVRRLAGGLLALGARPGDRLMIRMDNDLPYVLAFFAGLAAGLISFPSSAALTEEEAEFLLEDSGATMVVVSDSLAFHHALPEGVRVVDATTLLNLAATGPAIEPADTAADDPAFLIYTSGTTGQPKGVLHGQRVVWGRKPMHQGWLGLGPSDIMLHPGAFNWTYTLGVGLLDPWSVGATSVLYNGPSDPAHLPDLIERFGITLFATVPSLYRRMLKYGNLTPARMPSLRHGLTAGEPLTPALRDAWRAHTGKELYEALGMSEISTYISTGPGMALKPGSPGRPQPGRRITILDPDTSEGAPRELAVGETGLLAVHNSDPGLMLGYWQRPEEEILVRRGAWFAGGDLAHLDADGYVWFHGRNDDILKVSGYRLSPLEIERVLARHPAVADVAVGETTINEDLQVLTAFVVAHDPCVAHRACVERELLDWSREHLASYKRPKQIRFVESLPRAANGKLLRRLLPR
ncbi:AMP-dependent synthetase and ligase [uncultured Gammaproteobacteria bacterium]